MAKGKKKQLSLEEMLEEAIVKEEDRPYEVPGNWVWTRLGNIAQIVGGGTPSSSVDEYYENGAISWITPADLSGYMDIYISRGKRNITQLGLEKSSAKLMPKDTVLLSSRAPIGYVVIAENELCTNQGFKSFLPSYAYMPKYLLYYLKSIKHILESYASGTTFLELSGSKAALVEIPLSPLAEQQRIVDVIESLFEKLDRAKELVQNTLDSFENRRTIILEQAIRGHLTKEWRVNNPNYFTLTELEEIRIKKKYKKDINNTIEFDIPETWQWVCLGDLIDLLSDYHANGSYETLKKHVELLDEPSYACMIRTTNFEKDNFDTLMKYITKEAYEFMEKSKLYGDEILINKIGNAGSVYLMPKLQRPASLAMNLFMLRLNEKVSSKYVYYHLLSGFSEKDIKQFVRGVATKSIDKKSINSLKIALPPFDEQKEIIRNLDNLLEKDQRAKELSDVIEKIDLMKKAILARAFRGELGTNNLEEESAMELLKEVLKEKL